MIGIYVHNQGRGHLHRTCAVIRALHARGEEATVLLTGPVDRTLLPPGIPVVHLPCVGPEDGPDTDDEEPGGLALSARLAAVAWIDRVRPRCFCVDSSTEVALAAGMTDTPVVSTLPPAPREDPPHLLGCRTVERLLAPWPDGSHPETVEPLETTVAEVGGISRFEHLPAVERPRRRYPRVAHLNGATPGGDQRFWRAVRTLTERRGAVDWVEVGGADGGWDADVWPELGSADVVVTGGGQSAIADSACADVPLVVVPEHRPHRDQEATAEALTALDGAEVCRYGEGPRAIAAAVHRQIDRAADGVGGIRRGWRVDGAAARAADVIRGAAGQVKVV